MPYACHKCGATLEDGTPFCPNCGAPQIRVSTPESDQAVVPAQLEAASVEVQAPLIAPPALPFASPATFQWRGALRPILVGGLIILVGPMLPLGLLWNLLMILGGAMVAVALYRRQPLTGGEVPVRIGARIGAAAALFSFSISAILLVLGFLFDGPEIRRRFIEYFQATQGQLADPQSREVFQSILQKLNTPEGFATIVTLGMGMSLIFFLLLGAGGGALGAKLFGRARQDR